MTDESKGFVMKPWMWILMVAAVLMIALGFDPIGNLLSRHTGQSKQWVTNAVIILLLVAVLLFGRRRR